MSTGLTFKVFGHDVSLKSTLDGAQRNAAETSSKIKDSFKDIGKSILTDAGIVGIGELAGKSLEAADQLEGANIKIDHVFGESADQVKSWASGLAQSFGISQANAEATAGSFAQILTPLGKGQTVTAGMSEKLVELTANMARFNTADPAKVQTALISGLRGRATALRQYGVDISNTSIAAYAYSHGIAKQGAVLTDAQKTQASYNLILKETANQEGAVKDTTKTLAQQKQILTAQVQNLEAKIGTALLPVLTKLATYVTNDVVPGLEKAGTWIKNNRAWLEPLVAVIGVAAIAFKAAALAQEGWTIATGAASTVMALFTGAAEEATVASEELDVAMDANPIGLVVAAIAALAAGLVIAYKKSSTFRHIVQDAMHVVAVAFDFVKAHWGLLFAGLTGGLSLLLQHWHSVWGAVETVLRGVTSFVTGVARDLWTPLSYWLHIEWLVISKVYGWVKSGIRGVSSVVRPVVRAISGAFHGLGDGLQWVWDNVFKRIFGLIMAGVHAVESAVDAVKSAYDFVTGGSTAGDQNPVVGGTANRSGEGIPGHAQGAGFFAGGLTRINENGPEVVDLPRGSRITSHTSSMSQFGRGGGDTYNITVTLPNAVMSQAQADDMIATAVERAVGRGKRIRISKGIA